MGWNIKPENLTKVLQDQLDKIGQNAASSTEGTVIQVGDGVAKIYGLPNIFMGEVVEFSSGVRGLVFGLKVDFVDVAVLGDISLVQEGDSVCSLGESFSVPVGSNLLGRVVDAFGNPLDGKPLEVASMERSPVEMDSPGIMHRKGVHEPLQTGIKAIDSLVPIGKGQRELILGDRRTGKTTIAIDTICNQKDQNVICVYVAIGQKGSSVASVVNKLKEQGALEYSIVVAANADAPASLQFLAPYSGVTMASYFMYKSRHVMIAYDDLTKHAQAYRQMSLLFRRPPGREAYPGDVFYLHSRLLERGAKLSDEYGGGSITALPIVETQAGDVSSYIPTNVISITDGQVFLDTSLFNRGQMPAVDVGVSVSRVGGAAQTKAMKKAVGTMKFDLQQFVELKEFSQFSSDLDETVRQQLERGKKIQELLKQPPGKPMHMVDQVISLYAVNEGYFDRIPVEVLLVCEQELLEFFHTKYQTLWNSIKETGEFDKKDLQKVIREYLNTSY